MIPIVSFYTNTDGENYYSNCAKNLENKLISLGMEYVIKNKSFGYTWIDNVRAKPLFLKEMLLELNKDFIWLDIDCDILKKIDFNIKDKWAVSFREDATPHDFVHYVSNTKESIDFIDKWINEIDMSNGGSHSAFNNIIHEINHSEIPNGYFSIGLSKSDSKIEYFNPSSKNK